MSRTVIIESFDRVLPRTVGNCEVIAAVDVVRATTTAITAAATGRVCHIAPSLAAAFELADTLDHPLLVGEQAGLVPPGFHLNNSPHALSVRDDVARPMILLSTSGTRLCSEAAADRMTLLACLRNHAATAACLERFDRVALIGAATRGEFREEDQLCCAWIAARLLDRGYAPADATTERLVARWRNRGADAWLEGASAAYLRRSGQTADLEFILRHVNDLENAFGLSGGVVTTALPAAAREHLRSGAARPQA